MNNVTRKKLMEFRTVIRKLADEKIDTQKKRKILLKKDLIETLMSIVDKNILPLLLNILLK